MLMPTVLIPKDRSIAHVIRDTVEMESLVKVAMIHTILKPFVFSYFTLRVRTLLLLV